MLEHKGAHKCTWYQSTLGRRSMIDFVIVSSDSCFGHLGEERGGTFNGRPSVGELDQGMGEESRVDRPGKPKREMQVNWEHLEEAPVLGIFNSHLRRSFSGIPVEVGSIEPEWLVFKASIAEAAAVSCGFKGLGASRGGNPRGPWWSGKPSDWICYPMTPEAVVGYRRARRAAAAAMSEAEQQVWDKFGEAMEKDFRSAPKSNRN